MKKLFSSSLFQSAGIYTVANLLNAAIPFFMLPILTRYMSPTDYGIVAMFQVLVGFIGPFVGLSLHGAVSRQYLERDKVNLPAYIFNCFLILMTSTMMVSLIVLGFSESISTFTAFPREWLLAVVLMSMMQFTTQVALVLWQMRVKPVAYGAFQVLLTFTNVALSLWFVVGLSLGWQGRVQGQLFAMVFFGLIALVILLKNGYLRFSFERSYIKQALEFGIPLVPHTLGGWAITMTDRFFITHLEGVAATGVYAVGVQIGMILFLLQNSFNQAWSPWLFRQLKQDDWEVKRKIVKFTYGYFGVILLFAFALSAVSPWLLTYLVGPAYKGASQYVFWIALGYAFNGMYRMVGHYLFYVQKTRPLAWVTLFAGAANVLLTYVLVRANGTIGAAQATAISFLLSFLLTWVLSARSYPMPYNLKRKMPTDYSA